MYLFWNFFNWCL